MTGTFTFRAFDEAIKGLEECARDAKGEHEIEKKIWKTVQALKRKRALVLANLLLDDKARFE